MQQAQGSKPIDEQSPARAGMARTAHGGPAGIEATGARDAS